MRSDYMLYAVAIIFFILTVTVAAYAAEQQQLWIVITAVLGLAFIGIGYTQRPRETTVTQAQPPRGIPPPPPPTQPTTVEAPKKEEPVAIAQPQALAVQPQTLGEELTKVKGIKEKRAAQLKALGINNLEDLTKASAKDLAAKLQISPKITGKWIANAKEIKEKA